jgi:hypothetical protein
MCQMRQDGRAEGHELEIGVIEFDWAEEQGFAKYLAITNPDIP